ncbi:hypothetical protein NB693_20355 [Pantoea ananatis]|nr:hypothetical protein [Pantoea ananatis]
MLFPNAERKEPTGKPSSKLGSKLQKLIDTYNKGEDYAAVRAQADEILANSGANEYDKSLAAQLAAQAAYNLDDRRPRGVNGLDNNGHLMLAQLQLQEAGSRTGKGPAAFGRPHRRSQAGGAAGAGQGRQKAGRRQEDHQPEVARKKSPRLPVLKVVQVTGIGISCGVIAAPPRNPLWSSIGITTK